MWLLAASLSLSFAWAFGAWTYVAHRRPLPAGWTRVGWLSSATVLVVVLDGTFGLGAVLAAAFSPVETVRSLGLPTALATVAAPLLAALAVSALGVGVSRHV